MYAEGFWYYVACPYIIVLQRCHHTGFTHPFLTFPHHTDCPRAYAHARSVFIVVNTPSDQASGMCLYHRAIIEYDLITVSDHMPPSIYFCRWSHNRYM